MRQTNHFRNEPFFSSSSSFTNLNRNIIDTGLLLNYIELFFHHQQEAHYKFPPLFFFLKQTIIERIPAASLLILSRGWSYLYVKNERLGDLLFLGISLLKYNQ